MSNFAKTKRRIQVVTIFLLMMCATFVAFEGLSSAVLFGYDMIFRLDTTGLNSRVHVQRDAYLGWINIPDINIPDMYGLHAHLRINSQSFRNATDFDQAVPVGKQRIICSGDSFTLGVGVRNDHTWCSLLASMNPRFETINMGEAGYGLGQIYLKYEREGKSLEHDVHIVAFISDSFRRLTLSRYAAWNKPVVTLRHGELGVENLPVRRRLFFMPWVTYNSDKINQLRTIDLGRRMLRRLVPGASVPLPGGYQPYRKSKEEVHKITLAIFEQIDALNRQKGSRAIFVYLPENMKGRSGESERITSLKTALKVRGLHFIDLVSEFRRLPYSQLASMFDPKWGHYSERGNAYVAELLLARLMALPELANTHPAAGSQRSALSSSSR